MVQKDINISLKSIIKTAMDENGGKIELEQAKELIRPHFVFDTDELIERALTSKTRYMIYSFRDKKGVRQCVANNMGLYLDIESQDNLAELIEAEKQIRLKFAGIKKLLNKIRKQIKDIDGQISLPEIDDLEVKA